MPFPEQECGNAELGPALLGIEKEFRGIEADLAMDIDCAGEIGCEGVIQPVIISEPTARCGYDDKIAATRRKTPPL